MNKRTLAAAPVAGNATTGTAAAATLACGARLSVLALLAACAPGENGTGRGSVVEISTRGGQLILMSGSAGYAELAGDRIELRDGRVYLNGSLHGIVPPGAEVSYSVTAGERVLRVAGERRSATGPATNAVVSGLRAETR